MSVRDWVALLFVPTAALLYWWFFLRRRGKADFRRGDVVSINGVQRTVTKVDHRSSTITVDRPFE